MHHFKQAIALTASAAVLAVTAGSVATTGTSASVGAAAPGDPKTMVFNTYTDRGKGFGRTGFASTEINKLHGRRVGFDLISGRFNQKDRSLKIFVSVARRGGLLHGFVVAEGRRDNVFTGKVTGGQGRFKGATGRIRASEHAGREATRVKITYRLPG